MKKTVDILKAMTIDELKQILVDDSDQPNEKIANFKNTIREDFKKCVPVGGPDSLKQAENVVTALSQVAKEELTQENQHSFESIPEKLSIIHDIYVATGSECGEDAYLVFELLNGTNTVNYKLSLINDFIESINELGINLQLGNIQTLLRELLFSEMSQSEYDDRLKDENFSEEIQLMFSNRFSLMTAKKIDESEVQLGDLKIKIYKKIRELEASILEHAGTASIDEKKCREFSDIIHMLIMWRLRARNIKNDEVDAMMETINTTQQNVIYPKAIYPHRISVCDKNIRVLSMQKYDPSNYKRTLNNNSYAALRGYCSRLQHSKQTRTMVNVYEIILKLYEFEAISRVHGRAHNLLSNQVFPFLNENITTIDYDKKEANKHHITQIDQLNRLLSALKRYQDALENLDPTSLIYQNRKKLFNLKEKQVTDLLDQLVSGPCDGTDIEAIEKSVVVAENAFRGLKQLKVEADKEYPENTLLQDGLRTVYSKGDKLVYESLKADNTVETQSLADTICDVKAYNDAPNEKTLKSIEESVARAAAKPNYKTFLAGIALTVSGVLVFAAGAAVVGLGVAIAIGAASSVVGAALSIPAALGGYQGGAAMMVAGATMIAVGATMWGQNSNANTERKFAKAAKQVSEKDKQSREFYEGWSRLGSN